MRPITDPTVSTQDEGNKKKDSELDAPIEQEDTVPGAERRTDGPKRTQNNMLLMNAMSATAAHSKMSFTTSTQATESNPPDTPATTTMRSSATPAPQDLSAKSSLANIPPEGGKVQKKKKKRKCRVGNIPMSSNNILHLGASLAPPLANS